MNPTDEEIDALESWFRTGHAAPEPILKKFTYTADMLLALKARAEAAEKRVTELEAVLERIANESMDYQYVARAALEAKS